MGCNRTNGSSKERLKWTKELHDLFEKTVHQIGGPDRATPKGILRAMGIPGLTIYHVKSHLQKYRMSIFTREEDHARGKLERRNISEMFPNFSATSAAQLNEALQIQMEAERRLSDQLEVQKSLKMKFEAQRRFLDKILEEYNYRAPSSINKPVNPCSPELLLPSLSEESDGSNVKEFESDSEEVDANEIIMSKDESRAQKRIKIQDNFIPQTQNFGSMFCLDGMDNNLYAEQGISFPWSVGAFRSPELAAIYRPFN